MGGHRLGDCAMNGMGQRWALITLALAGLTGCHYFAPCPGPCGYQDGYGDCVGPCQGGCDAGCQSGFSPGTCGCQNSADNCGCHEGGGSRFWNRRSSRRDRRSGCGCGQQGRGCQCQCGGGSGWCSPCDPCSTGCDPCGGCVSCGDCWTPGCGMVMSGPCGSCGDCGNFGGMPCASGGCPMMNGTYLGDQFSGDMVPQGATPGLAPAPPSTFGEPAPSPAPPVEEGQFYSPQNIQQPSKSGSGATFFAPSASRPVQQVLWVPSNL